MFDFFARCLGGARKVYGEHLPPPLCPPSPSHVALVGAFFSATAQKPGPEIYGQVFAGASCVWFSLARCGPSSTIGPAIGAAAAAALELIQGGRRALSLSRPLSHASREQPHSRPPVIRGGRCLGGPSGPHEAGAQRSHLHSLSRWLARAAAATSLSLSRSLIFSRPARHTCAAFWRANGTQDKTKTNKPPGQPPAPKASATDMHLDLGQGCCKIPTQRLVSANTTTVLGSLKFGRLRHRSQSQRPDLSIR